MIRISFQFFGGRGSSGKSAGGGGGGAQSFAVLNTAEEMFEFFSNDFDNWSATKAEKNATSEYTGTAYRTVNGVLRKTYDINSLSQQTQTEILDTAEKIASGVSKFNLSENITVYRGVNLDAFGFKPDASQKEMKSLVGSMFTDNGFMSTSAVKGEEFGYKAASMTIKVPKGKGRGAWISPISDYPYENEFLLQKSSVLKITNVKQNDNGKWEIEAELVGNNY